MRTPRALRLRRIVLSTTRYGPALSRIMAQSPVGSRIRLPVMLVGAPQVCPLEKSRKHFDPMLVLFTTENTIRLEILRSEIFERRNRFFQACQLPMTLWMP